MIEASSKGAFIDLESKLRPFVARRVRAEDVDDVVQDVFVRMLRGLSALRDEERFGPWVYQVARSAIADQLRASARQPLASGPPPDEEAPPPDADDDGAIERELSSYVAFFVAMLPPPYREALTLTELEGMTQKDAAAMLGISVSGMKSRVQRGRERLRRLLEDCCHIGLDPRGRVIACDPRPDGTVPDCSCD